MIETLKQLAQLDGPPGYEDRIRNFIIKNLPEEFEKYTDKIGNLIVSNKKKNKPAIMLVAHMDEVGFMVQHITNEGFIKFVELGGWDERILPSMKVKLLGIIDIIGTIGSIPPHMIEEKEKDKPYRLKDLWIDTGYTKEELNKFGINVGTFITPYSEFIFNDDVIISKALDDRVGCYSMLQISELAKEINNEVILCFTVQEEVGLRGARIVSNQLNPDLAIIIECTAAGDLPGIEENMQPTKLLDGASITVMDKRFIANKKYFDFLIEVAKKYNIKYQIKKPSFGATDAGEIHLSKNGVPSLVISCPARYIHSPTSITKYSNVENVVKLVKSAILEFQEFVNF